MKTLMKLAFVLVFAISLGSCKDKTPEITEDPADVSTVDVAADTVATDTITDDDAPGVTKGEMEQIP